MRQVDSGVRGSSARTAEIGGSSAPAAEMFPACGFVHVESLRLHFVLHPTTSGIRHCYFLLVCLF